MILHQEYLDLARVSIPNTSQKREYFNIQAEVFNRRSVSAEEIAVASEKALLGLYSR